MSLSSSVPKVLLVEGNISGHRLFYVKLLALEALSRGYSVHLATAPGASRTAEFCTHLNDCKADIEIVEMQDFQLKSIEKLSRELNADRTIVPDGDATALQLMKNGRWRGQGCLSVLIMRENAQHEASQLVRITKQLAKRVVMFRVQNIPRVDLTVLKSATWSGKSRNKIALDPVVVSCSETDVRKTREAWKLEESRYWFAVLGAITSRKNLPLLLDCVADLAPGEYGLLVAGRVDASVRSATEDAISKLNDMEIPVVMVDRLLTDVELDAGVSAADCLVLAHSNEGPSGLLGKAACMGTRVIAAGANSLRRDIASLGEGAEWTRLSRYEITEAMKRAVLSPTVVPGFAASSQSFTDALLVPTDRKTV